MNKTTLLLTSMGLTILASAQITLDQNNMPHSANHSDIRATNTTAIAIPAHGANLMYDYSTLSNADVDTIPYIDATRTGFETYTRFNYGSTMLAQLQLFSEYYTHKLTDGIARVGAYKLPETFNISTISGGPNDELVFPGGSSIFVNPSYQVKFPSTYGTTWTASFKYQTDFALSVAAFGLTNAPGQQRQYVSQVDSVVGWGQLRVPTTSGVSIYYDVLLMKQQLTFIDSVFLNGSPAPAPLLSAFGLAQGQTGASNSYVFYAAGFERPLLIIGMSNDWQTAERSFHTANGLATFGLNEMDNFTKATVYPNPTAAGSTVYFDALPNGNTTDLWVFDVYGKVVHRESLSSNGATNMQWQVPANYKAGIYMYQLWENGNCRHGKLIVE